MGETVDEPVKKPAETAVEKLQKLLRSRKFWALVAAVVTAAGAHATGQIDAWQAIQAIVAALAAYSVSIGLVDAGAEAARRDG
jgi:hypothetical protein